MARITIDTDDGKMSAYLAVPHGGVGPGIVLIQEIFGVNKVMRDLADGLAAEGFVTVCPDLFWRIEPGIDITDRTEAEWAQAFQLFQAFDVAAGVRDLAHTLDATRGLDGCTGRVGAVGYCLGGKLAYLMAARTEVDCAVGYYGVGIHEMLGEAKGIRHPLMLHVAGKDRFVPPAAQRQMHEGLDRNPHVTLYDYPGNDHAFARMGGEHYDRDSAALANRRTIAFFKEHLA
jgi:carboxymethylenebutenolidase